MKTFRYFAFGLFAASLFIACSTVVSASSAPDDERAGYQGIPVRNGLNRGVVRHDASPAVQRYPRLPRRPNETDIAQSAPADGYQARNQNDQDRGGYAGIPQRGSHPNEMQRGENPDARGIERAGYGGIPQGIVAAHETPRGNTLAAQRPSGLVRSK